MTNSESPVFVSETADERTGAKRPFGAVWPKESHAHRALQALREGRVQDAKQEAESIPQVELVDRAWKLLVDGLAVAERAKLGEAERLLLQAAAQAFVSGAGTSGLSDGPRLRVAGLMFHHLGWVYRRRERPDDASQAHLVAYYLRERHGSREELWDTAIELGLDYDVAKRFTDAQRWHRTAIDMSEQLAEPSEEKQAIAWSNLAASLMEEGRCEEAVSAARNSRERWRAHDVGAVTASLADMKLGSALLQLGQGLHESNPSEARSVLNEAMSQLTAAHEALSAFGKGYAGDAQTCAEQQDLAERLLASLPG